MFGLIQFFGPLWAHPTAPLELADPKYQPQEITALFQKSAQSIMTFDYTNIDQELQQSQTYFTKAGWESFYRALNDANIIEATKNRKLHVSLEVLQTPIINKAGLEDGIYTWLMEAPIVINFESDVKGKSIPSIHTDLAIKIERSPLNENPNGIGIVQWVTYSK